MTHGTSQQAGKPDFGAPNCPVRALRYYHRCMTDRSELRKGRRRLFIQDTTRRGRSSVQPLFLVGSAPLYGILMLPFRTETASQERSKLQRSVLWLLRYNFSTSRPKASHESLEVVQWRHLHILLLRDLCP